MSLRVRKLSKRFRTGRLALDDVNIEVRQAEMVALIGASGSGKSTLLRHLTGLLAGEPTPGSLVEIGGQVVQREGQIAGNIRAVRAQIGLIFQQFNLVDRLPVITNVLVGRLHAMPWWRGLARIFTDAERAMALEALRRVGIGECYAQRASTLSGGQQQRAAIARTLVQGAKVVLADEPIASLDPEASRKVMEILSRINREDGSTVIVSLHQVDMALRYCPRVVALHQGRVVYDGPSEALTPALLRGFYGMQAEEILTSSSLLDQPPAPAHPPTCWIAQEAREAA